MRHQSRKTKTAHSSILFAKFYFIKINHNRSHSSKHLNIDHNSILFCIDFSHDSFGTREISIFECHDITYSVWYDHCRSLIPLLHLAMNIFVFFISERYRMRLCTDDDSHSWRISDDIPDLIIHSRSNKDITRVEFLFLDNFLTCFHLRLHHDRNIIIDDIIFERLFSHSFFEILYDEIFLSCDDAKYISLMRFIFDLFFEFCLCDSNHAIMEDEKLKEYNSYLFSPVTTRPVVISFISVPDISLTPESSDEISCVGVVSSADLIAV